MDRVGPVFLPGTADYLQSDLLQQDLVQSVSQAAFLAGQQELPELQLSPEGVVTQLVRVRPRPVMVSRNKVWIDFFMTSALTRNRRKHSSKSDEYAFAGSSEKFWRFALYGEGSQITGMSFSFSVAPC